MSARFLAPMLMALALIFLNCLHCRAETEHKVYFDGYDSRLDVYFIKGATPGPTLLLLGGIQGDEPGGYLTADLYADVSLRKGNMIVVPRANFQSIVKNSRGVHGDMNRKFALAYNPSDREVAVVKIIKDLMKQSDFFLNLHDGSGFFSDKWQSQMQNPMRFGQSIISDAAEHKLPDGRIIHMEATAQRVLDRVNTQIDNPQHRFSFNNHRTLAQNSRHKEQRLSATFHALTQVGIPAFGVETSKDINNFELRVRYQTAVINAFLEEFGIVMETPKICLDSPFMRFLIVSVNGQTPIVLRAKDTLTVAPGDKVKIVHVEANYTRGLTAKVKSSGDRIDDVGHELTITKNTVIEVRKDRFLMAGVPLEVTRPKSQSKGRKGEEPKVRYFLIRVNDKPVLVEPGERAHVMRGDLLTIMDPRTNLDGEDEKDLKVDLRGFQVQSSTDPSDDRGHVVDTALDLQEKYAKVEAGVKVYPLQAKVGGRVIAESSLGVSEPKLEYVVLRRDTGPPFVAYSGDVVELPPEGILTIMDLKTNSPEGAPLYVAMAGHKVKWRRSGSAAIDSERLKKEEMSLEVTRNGLSIGKIWMKRGPETRVSRQGSEPAAPVVRVRY